MIKALPGWLNFFILWAGYLVLGFLIKWISGSKAEPLFVCLLTAVFCGAYLAKWRFYDGGWHFR